MAKEPGIPWREAFADSFQLGNTRPQHGIFPLQAVDFLPCEQRPVVGR